MDLARMGNPIRV
ncbi:hypothetical protein F383_21946 [Gossypium arboreum]|nr:hypothetical protein F383_21946 [Gossypium arboreum]